MLKKICSILSTIILILLAILAALMLLPRAFGYNTMAVLTGSMEPNYHVGSLIYVKDVDPSTLEVGDVITYRLSEDTVVTHRVVEINTDEKTFITKGDANADNDGNPVTYEAIVGKADYTVPYLGYIAINAKTPKGIIAVCAVLVVIIVLNFLPEIFTKEEEKKPEEKDDSSENN